MQLYDVYTKMLSNKMGFSDKQCGTHIDDVSDVLQLKSHRLSFERTLSLCLQVQCSLICKEHCKSI